MEQNEFLFGNRPAKEGRLKIEFIKTLEAGVEAPTTDILLLGCNRGFLFKFEKSAGEEVWRKTGECRLQLNVTDILQIHPLTVVAV